MSRYVRKEDAIGVLHILQDKMSASGVRALESAIGAIEDLDEADVVEVVRCKDCRHKHPYNNVWLCRFGLMMPGDDGYCSYGEKVSE